MTEYRSDLLERTCMAMYFDSSSDKMRGDIKE